MEERTRTERNHSRQAPLPTEQPVQRNLAETRPGAGRNRSRFGRNRLSSRLPPTNHFRDDCQCVGVPRRRRNVACQLSIALLSAGGAIHPAKRHQHEVIPSRTPWRNSKNQMIYPNPRAGEVSKLTKVDDRSTILRKMRETNTRNALIQEGLRSFLAFGYDGVGIGPVLSAVNVPKGSFYHFFRSKEDFAVAVLEAYVARYASLRESLENDKTRPPLDRLRAHFDALEIELVADFPAGGCLYGVLSQTITTLGPVLRKRLQGSFRIWQESILSVLLQAQHLGDLDPAINAQEAAAFLIDAYEGALIRMKSDGVAPPFGRFRQFALEPLLTQTSRATASVPARMAARRKKKGGLPKSTSDKPSKNAVSARR